MVKKYNDRTCKNCGDRYPGRYASGAPKKSDYCSNRCASRARKRGGDAQCCMCGTVFYATRGRLAQKNVFCGFKCRGKWLSLNVTGGKHPQYNGGKSTFNGYVRLSINGEIIFEHRYVMEKIIGRKLNKNEDVHHINGVRSDNRAENLRLMNERDHVKLHAVLRSLKQGHES